jgi:hypothetical protein
MLQSANRKEMSYGSLLALFNDHLEISYSNMPRFVRLSFSAGCDGKPLS